MIGTPLVVSDQELKTLREYAEAHKIPAPELVLMSKGQAPLAGDRDGHILIPGYSPDPKKNADFGWKVVYSIEEHPQSNGTTIWFRHMSMSIARDGRHPNQYALDLIARGLGFPPLAECRVQQNPVDGFIEVLAIYDEKPLDTGGL